MDLSVVDYKNILALMTRVSYQGLAEAEAAVVLTARIKAAIEKLETPKEIYKVE